MPIHHPKQHSETPVKERQKLKNAYWVKLEVETNKTHIIKKWPTTEMGSHLGHGTCALISQTIIYTVKPGWLQIIYQSFWDYTAGKVHAIVSKQASTFFNALDAKTQWDIEQEAIIIAHRSYNR